MNVVAQLPWALLSGVLSRASLPPAPAAPAQRTGAVPAQHPVKTTPLRVLGGSRSKTRLSTADKFVGKLQGAGKTKRSISMPSRGELSPGCWPALESLLGAAALDVPRGDTLGTPRAGLAKVWGPAAAWGCWGARRGQGRGDLQNPSEAELLGQAGMIHFREFS